MKYIIEFNENIQGSREDLRDFCEIYLAYLLDEGFILRIYGGTQLTGRVTPFQITLKKQDSSIFLWESIVDSFLPFLKLLKDNYTLERVEPHSQVPSISRADISFMDYKYRNLKIQTKSLLRDNISSINKMKLREIYFEVKY